MPPKKENALPVAANHGAISNRISMLLAAQSSFLKTLNPPSHSPSSSSRQNTQRRQNRSVHDLDKEDEDLFKNNARPNEGVGYVAPSSGAQSAQDRRKEDQALRGRIMGKNGRNRTDVPGKGKGRSLPKEESESEEEAGRSALGKRKRPRREASPVKAQTEEHAGGDGAVGKGLTETIEEPVGEKEVEVVGPEAQTGEGQSGQKKRKKNKKNKNKNKQAAAGDP